MASRIHSVYYLQTATSGLTEQGTRRRAGANTSFLSGCSHKLFHGRHSHGGQRPRGTLDSGGTRQAANCRNPSWASINERHGARESRSAHRLNSLPQSLTGQGTRLPLTTDEEGVKTAVKASVVYCECFIYTGTPSFGLRQNVSRGERALSTSLFLYVQSPARCLLHRTFPLMATRLLV